MRKGRLGQYITMPPGAVDYSKYIPDGWYVPPGAGQVEWPTCPVTNKPAMVHTMPWGLNVAICPKPASPEIVYLAPGSSGGGPYPLKMTFKYPYQEWPPISLVAPTLPGFVPQGAAQAAYHYGVIPPPSYGVPTAPGGFGNISEMIGKIPMWAWLAVGGVILVISMRR